MNYRRIAPLVLCLCFTCNTALRGQDMDTALSKMTEDLATMIQTHGKKKVAVLDFTDLQGTTTELGRYVAEQLTVDMVMNNRPFSVVDRANLKSILAEHKLTATGLVNPENAKKLGMFSGVDALILGTIIPRGDNVAVTAKIITTDTAEIVGGAKTEFKSDATTKQLVAKPAAETGSEAVTDDLKPDKAQVVKTLGDLHVEMQPIRIVDGTQYELTMLLTNRDQSESIWVALNSDLNNQPDARLTGPDGYEYRTSPEFLSGIQMGRKAPQYFQPYADDPRPPQQKRFSPAVEIRPGDSLSTTVRFMAPYRRPVEPGVCSLQMEFLVGRNFNYADVHVTTENLVTKISAENGRKIK